MTVPICDKLTFHLAKLVNRLEIGGGEKCSYFGFHRGQFVSAFRGCEGANVAAFFLSITIYAKLNFPGGKLETSPNRLSDVLPLLTPPKNDKKD